MGSHSGPCNLFYTPSRGAHALHEVTYEYGRQRSTRPSRALNHGPRLAAWARLRVDPKPWVRVLSEQVSTDGGETSGINRTGRAVPLFVVILDGATGHLMG